MHCLSAALSTIRTGTSTWSERHLQQLSTSLQRFKSPRMLIFKGKDSLFLSATAAAAAAEELQHTLNCTAPLCCKSVTTSEEGEIESNPSASWEDASVIRIFCTASGVALKPPLKLLKRSSTWRGRRPSAQSSSSFVLWIVCRFEVDFLLLMLLLLSVTSEEETAGSGGSWISLNSSPTPVVKLSRRIRWLLVSAINSSSSE